MHVMDALTGESKSLVHLILKGSFTSWASEPAGLLYRPDYQWSSFSPFNLTFIWTQRSPQAPETPEAWKKFPDVGTWIFISHMHSTLTVVHGDQAHESKSYENSIFYGVLLGLMVLGWWQNLYPHSYSPVFMPYKKHLPSAGFSCPS